MTDKQSNDSRRKLLTSIAIGSGAVVAGKTLPESWSKPVVDTVMLPAHASTTKPTPLPTSYSGNLDFRPQMDGQNSPLDNVLSVLVQDAHALIDEYVPMPTIAEVGSMCVDTSNAPMFTAKVLVSNEEFSDYFEGTGTIGSAAGVDVEQKFGCDSFGTVNVAIKSNDANGAVYTVTANNGDRAASGTILEGNTCPKTPGDCAGSDIRLKTNVEAISTSREGFDLYKFQYLNDADENTYVGVMAQDVMSRYPEAIVQNDSGFYMVRYGLLGLRMVTLDEWELEGPNSVELIH